jgi:thiol:disulfide interchange protein
MLFKKSNYTISAFFIAFLLLYKSTGFAQVIKPVKWKYTFSANEIPKGGKVDLIFKAVIDDQYHIYSSDFNTDSSYAVPATFNFVPHPSYELVGKIKAIKSKKGQDEYIGKYTYFENNAEFRQTIKILNDRLSIVGELAGQVCNQGQCRQYDDHFEFTGIKILPGLDQETGNKKTAPAVIAPDSNEKQHVEIKIPPASNKNLYEIQEKLKKTGISRKKSSLWDFMFFAFAAGLFALITPCVFPMVPMTVTFFTNSSTSRAHAIRKALIYGISIVVIYGIIGLVVSRFNGPEVANVLATHWAPNLLFFFIFFFFGLSFLGLFEITLPASFVNRVDAQADKGGMAGIFFMAFTIVLVSFSCTGPIVGGILVLAAGGEVLKPVLGMLSYSMAFAIPFTLFAMFPNWLNKLPKSGGWLNVIKVSLGFIELALGLKFLSVADQVYHWNLLDREIYISIWLALSILLGIYFLGKIRLPHDSETHVTTVPRLLLAILSFTFAAYLLPGLFGAPLKALSGYLPPMSTHDFDIPGIIREYSTGSGKPGEEAMNLCEEPKYGDQLYLPHGLHGFFDYQQALRCAREKALPLFIDFTGHGCVNCREMEANVWADPHVLDLLKNDFMIVALYVDDPLKVKKEEVYTSTYDHKIKSSLGAQNADLQITKFDNNAQPFYVLLNPYTETPLVAPIGYEGSVTKFLDYLKEGKKNFEASRPKTSSTK